MIRPVSTFAHMGLVLCLVCVWSGNARATVFSSVDLDLDDPSTGNNRFSTIFRVTEVVSSTTVDGGPEIVDYVDENQSGMQVNLDIDFSDLDSPIVNTIEFVGEPGDISHVFTGGAIPVEFDNGFIAVDIDAVPNGVKGFLRTQGGPISVNPDGSFAAGNTNLVARQGTVDIDGTLTSLLGALTVDETFNLADTPLTGFNDSISAGSLNNVAINFTGIDGADRVYEVVVSTVLENTELPFSISGFDLVLDITGTLQGAGEIRIPAIPEPMSLVLLASSLLVAANVRRR